MKWFLYGALLLIVTLVLVVVQAPLSFVLERAQSSLPALTYTSANGTVWNGEANGLRYGIQPIGNVRVATEMGALLGGTYKASMLLQGGAVTATGKIAAGMNGAVKLSDVGVRGNTGQLLLLRSDVRDLNGEFTLNLARLEIKDRYCQSGQGQAWTDLLTRLQTAYGWAGPELSGPVSCEGGNIVLQLTGENEAGESVRMDVNMSLNATGQFHAEIKNASEDTIRAASLLGFVYTEDALIYDYRIEN